MQRIFPRLCATLFVAAFIPPAASAQVFTDRAAFEAAQPKARAATYPAFDSLAVVAPSGPFGVLADSGCDESIVASFGSNSVTITAPAAAPLLGLMHAICIYGPNSFALLPQSNTDPDPASPTILANGEDDFDLVFESPVLAVGFEVVSNSAAIDSLELFDPNGQSIGVVRDPDLETDPNAFEFFGVVSAIPIGAISIDTTDGTIQNVGLIEILVPVGGPAPPEVEYPGDTDTLQEAIDLVVDGGTIKMLAGLYQEHVFIDKALKIIGAGRKKTILVGSGDLPDPQTQLPDFDVTRLNPGITLLPGADLELYDFGFSDQEVAVLVDGAKALFKDVRITDSAVGIAGALSELVMHDLHMKVGYIGTLITQWKGDGTQFGLEMTDTFVENPSKIGILIINSNPLGLDGGSIVIKDTHVKDVLALDTGESAALGGIIIVGDAFPVTIRDTWVEDVGLIGIGLYSTQDVTIEDVTVQDVTPRDLILGGELFEDVGYGVQARDSGFLDFENLHVFDIPDAGLLFDGSSSGRIRQTRSKARRFGLVLQGAVSIDWQDESNSFYGSERDTLIDGSLAVPDAPVLPGQ